jgi:hypothetical protein
MKHSLGDTSQDALLESAFYGLLTEVKFCKVKPEAMGSVVSCVGIKFEPLLLTHPAH